MIDVSHKPTSLRTAIARATLRVSARSIARIRERTVPKGDPLEVARAATALAVKNTPQLIPYCHPVRIDWVHTEFEIGEDSLDVEVTVRAVDRTGVEVEAMAGASAAALVVYDMLKMIDDDMSIESVRLVEKRGGKSSERSQDVAGIRAAVLVASDSIAAGHKQDVAGRVIRERLEAQGLEGVDHRVVPDEPEEIARAVRRWIDDEGVRLVLTTGGTGLGPRDRTPEAMDGLFEREATGVVEAARAHGQARTSRSMLSRGRAGIRGDALIVNLPGSVGGVSDSLDALLPAILHAVEMLRGGGHEDDPRSGARR